MDLKNGDANKGKQLVAENCTACHGIKSQNIPAPMDSLKREQLFWGRAADLSHVAGVLNANFLAHFIKDPVKTAKLSHKFNDERPYPMRRFLNLVIKI